jgi:hypothetical protein
MASPAAAQSEPAAEEPRTAEEFIETAREVYTVIKKPEPIVCPTPTGDEIVVCARPDRPSDQRGPGPTERALAAGERPPDRIPDAPDVFGIPPCKSYLFCTKMGSAPPPIYIVDLTDLPEPLPPEQAALVFRAEDQPDPDAIPAEASPAATP